MTVSVATTACGLGRLGVAWTDAGVCAVAFGDDDAALRAELGGVPGASPWVDAVRGVVDGGSGDVPLDLRGTPFQLRVWAALRRIPAGVTRSYADLAAELDLPAGSVRAVGRACATNPVAVLVPCHRVVRADGALAGYRWGLARKRALLDRESGADDRQLSVF